MAVTTLKPDKSNGPRDILAELSGHKPEPETKPSAVAIMEWKDPNLLEKMGVLAVDPDLPKPKENIFNAGPDNTEVNKLKAHGGGSIAGAQYSGSEHTGDHNARKQEELHNKTYSRIITAAMVGAAISDELSRTVSSVISEQMKGINSTHGRLTQLKQDVAALEDVRPDLNLLYEELTPEQKKVENQLEAAETEKIQTEYLIQPAELNDTLLQASKAIAEMEGVDPEIAEAAIRGDYMREAKLILMGEMSPEDAHPLSAQMAQDVISGFEGSKQELQSMAEQANVSADPGMEPTFMADPNGIYRDPNIISPIASSNEFDPFNGVSVAATLAPDSIRDKMDDEMVGTPDPASRFVYAVAPSIGPGIPAKLTTPAPQYIGDDPLIRQMVEGQVPREPAPNMAMVGV
jgi:hypothetical protein